MNFPNNIFKTLVLICLIAGSSSPILAKHIIGGDISYTCLGGGNYRFIMKIYRDCNDPTGAPFDNEAVITVYRGDSPPYTRFANRMIPILEIIDVEPNTSNPCLIVPPNVCVEEGTYVFDLLLPLEPESYHISYQRCCRNNTISNINNPGGSGATYTIELTAEAQSVCNNSPVFNEFPPIVICANEDINFDHSASDPEGDILRYEFCTPLLGGGTLGTPNNPGDPSAPNGVAPDPASSPPYFPVSFVTPLYTFDQPMGGLPAVTIDPITGLISGVPNTLGQFVVGVCVVEIRGNDTLSITRRDFQFNVADCEPTVFAEIEHDAVLGAQQYVINSCGNNTISFVNQSYQTQFINSYDWSFDIGGMMQTFNSRDVTVTFPDTGLYNGRMIVNPGTECSDSADIFVRIFPEVFAEFDYVYDTCIAGPVSFTDSSFGDAGVTNWNWDFGDSNSSSIQSPNHIYMQPGNHFVSLEVTDANGCQNVLTERIEYFPVPALIVVDPSTFNGCAPELVTLDNLSFPIDTTYDILWDLGDGNFSTAISPQHLYEDPGVYSLNVQITSPIGCYIERNFPNFVTVRPSPTAGFSCNPEDPSNFNPTVDFIDESMDASRWFWSFGGQGTSIEQSPTFTFRDTGIAEIRQIVIHDSGCQDTLYKTLDVEPLIRYFIPNAFTPNEDGKNDSFFGKGVLEGITNFDLSIWNRWGELVFQTNDPTAGWNGRLNNNGKHMQNGVYVYLVSFLGPRRDKFQYKGYATLIR